MRRSMPSGVTLLELLVVLSAIGLLLGLSYSPIRRGLDQLAVDSARESLGAGLARARSIAIVRGGANLIVDLEGAAFWVESVGGDTLGGVTYLGARYGVELTTVGAPADQVVLRFDRLGIGRLTNRTLRLERGTARAHLALSAYGRLRRW